MTVKLLVDHIEHTMKLALRTHRHRIPDGGKVLGVALVFGTVCLADLPAQIINAEETQPDFNVARSALGSGLLYISDVVIETEEPSDLLNEKVDLIHDDETLTAELPEDRSLFIVRLKDASFVDSFRFYNFEAAGTVTAYVQPLPETPLSENSTEGMAASEQWIQVSDPVEFSEPGAVAVWFNEKLESQLVRIVFETTRPGLISGFGVAGTFFRGADPSQVKLVRQVQATDRQDLTNVLSFGSGARVVAVSGGMAPSDKAMIDDLVETTHVYSETDPTPMALFDLEEPREIERVTVLIDSPAPTRMEMYFLDTLDDLEFREEPGRTAASFVTTGPALASLNGPLAVGGQFSGAAGFFTSFTVPDSFFDNNIPSVVAEFEAGERKARADVGSSSFARWVLVRWVYQNGIPPEFGGLVVNELNLLGRYTWFYEDEGPEPPAEGPDAITTFPIDFDLSIDPPQVPPVSP